MERLTARDDYGTPYYPYCDDVKKCGGYCAQCNFETKISEKLAAYEDAEEQGLLVKLPCKVGDTVWFVGNKFVNDYEIRRFIVGEIGIDAIQVAKTIRGTDYWNSFSIDDIGKTVFLTQAEAEQKLKEMKP